MTLYKYVDCTKQGEVQEVGRQGLASLKDARDTFRAMTKLVEGIKGNFKDRFKNSDR